MKGRERTIRFLNDEGVDRLPFHPLVMQFAARQAGVPYGEYCLEPARHADAMIHCAEHLGLDYVHTGGYPYCEAIAYGLEVEFPVNNLPMQRGHLIDDPTRDLGKIKSLNVEDHELMMKRVELAGLYKQRTGDELFVCGWFEGPMAEYADLRGLSGACLDLYDHPEGVAEAMAVLVDNAKKWAKLQAEAGADCIGIGDAACSQIGPKLYEKFVFEHHRSLVEYIHGLGVYSKLHICGNITQLMPRLIETGVNILDVDHLVKDMAPFVDLLGPRQVLLGNLDPVSIVQDGTPELVREEVIRCAQETRGRGIVSAGCEIPVDTPAENYRAFFEAAGEVSGMGFDVRLA